MRRLQVKRPDGHTVRLALTYLLIIMVMSSSFSVVVYRSSVSQIRIQNQNSSSKKSATNQLALFASTGKKTNSKYKVLAGGHVTQADIANLNRQIQQTLATIRSNELRRLVLLNTAVLVLGSGLSYFLARRTLRPIENAMEAQVRFASDASHELRTPLAAMQAENEEVLRTSKLPGRARNLITSNLEEITRLKELAEGLLRLSHDDKPHDLRPVWIDDAGTEAINRIIKEAQAKNITAEDGLLHLQVIGDKKSLVQILVILLDNAIKYSDSNSVIHLESIQNDRSILLHIRDEGMGIDHAQLPRVFDRFYRADQSRSRHAVDGHGLGLSIAQKLTRLQNGELSAESTLGKGSTFTIKLKAA